MQINILRVTSWQQGEQHHGLLSFETTCLRVSNVIQFFDREFIVMDENVRELVDYTINDLEYKFISSIRRVTHEKKKTRTDPPSCRED